MLLKSAGAIPAIKTLPIIVAAALLLSGCTLLFQYEDLRPAPSHIKPLNLKEIPVEFSHRWNKDKNFHLVGSAAIDIDNDGRFEIFVGGGQGQDDALLSFEKGRLVDRIKGTGLSSLDATYGATAIDIDNDKDVDLIVVRDGGITIYRAVGGGKFKPSALPLKLPPYSVPLSATPIDIERDGDIDLYISVFISSDKFRSVTYNDPTHRRYNVLLRNDGNLKFTNITDKATRGKQNTFTAASADLNNDFYPDLVLAHNTGQVEILKNRGNGTFTSTDLKTDYGFWMGVALGDADNDGDIDLVFSNSGTSIPTWLLMGDLKAGQKFNGLWALLRNDGDFNFTDIAGEAGIAALGFGWGAVFEDLNYDGAIDLLGSQNYVNWPLHKLFKLPGKIMLNDPRSLPSFYAVDAGRDSHYSHTPLLVDVNGDSKPDIIWINTNSRLRAFLNLTRGNYLPVQVPDNALSLGAVIKVKSGGRVYTKQMTSSQGLTGDQPPVILFGLSESRSVDNVEVRWANGRITRRANPPINRVLSIKP